jgi:hypothetical protein
MHLSAPTYKLHTLLILILFILPTECYSVRKREQKNFSLCSLHSPVTSTHLGPNILHSTLLSKILSLHFFQNASEQILHPYKTTGQIIVSWKTKVSVPNDKRYYGNALRICKI